METKKLNTISRFLYNPKLSAITICVLCFTGMITARYLEKWFRFSDYRWIYQYGSLLSKGIVLLMIGWSFFHPLIVISEKRKQWKKYWIWILIGLLPFLYFGIMMTIAMSRTVE
ncbi:hypothetical protein [Cellulophaga tyrosinoxydans]|uniref:Uncharacterized protein n=1 Tax=Cellulophaga tyrosinoxydans TaxID=504486 RepID=A0A1W2BE60_9FLAO|nr:hypothetical protein [Cellulophaga tyrosinoxydans]SMC71277.1 hypothetical protein SAMN05660703_2343 [Cellulophaga tyrosinoxydans]